MHRHKGKFRAALALLMVTAGVGHFLAPEGFVPMVPPYLPGALALVLISGFFEILGGVGLLVPRFRRAAAWGLVLLYIAVLPANLHVALHPMPLFGVQMSPLALWLRLPFQLVFIAWALWSTSEPQQKTTLS